MSGRFNPKSLLVVAGDVSGDRHTAGLLAKLKQFEPDLAIWGVGGPEMETQGAKLIANCRDFAVIGIFEVIKQIPFFAGVRARILEELETNAPNAVLLVDFGGFNLNLAAAIRKLYPQLPILYFISPQVWGSRPWRINVIARTVTKMLVIFPFEEMLYLNRGIPARFVGHPLTLNLPDKSTLQKRHEFCAAYGFDPKKPIIGVFAGSRRREIKDLFPVVLEAMQWLLDERKELQFAVSQANPVIADAIHEAVSRSKLNSRIGSGVSLISPQDNYNLMSNADLLWAKSGTTTLEATLFGKPMLIFYRGMWLSYFIVVMFKRVKHVGWPNLLAGEEIVPELIQLDCRAQQLVKYTLDLLDVPALRHEVSERLLSLRGELGQGDYTINCAQEILNAMGLSKAQLLPG